MRHLLFNRMNPPAMTVWQRRRAEVRRRLRMLGAEFQDTVMCLRVVGGGDLGVGLGMAWLLFLATWRDAHQPPDVDQPAKAYWWIVQLVIVIVAAVVAVAMAPKPPQPKPAALQDFDVPTAEEGRPIPKVFGEMWVRDPNVLWYGDLRAIPIKKKGGKK